MKINFGKFLDRKINIDWDMWDTLPIGAHAYTRRNIRENTETLGYEYFYRSKDGRVFIIENPTVSEAAWARTFGYKGSKISGYRSSATRVETTKELKKILEGSEKQRGE